MRGTKILALAVTLMLAGVVLTPGLTYAGEVGEPPLPPVEGGDESGEGEVGEPPLPGDEDDEGTKPSLPGDDEEATPVSVYDRAIASLEGLNTAEALQAALDAVDAQIPNWNVWKYVPYAEKQALGGYGLGFSADVEKGIIAWSWGTTSTANTHIVTALIPLEDFESTDENPSYWEQPEVKKLLEMSLPDLIAYAKEQSAYETSEKLQERVARAEEGYNNGMNYLKMAVEALTDSENVDAMTAEQLISALAALPEYEAYGLADVPEGLVDGNGLYVAYARAYSALGRPAGVDEDDQKELYANLVVEATEINPDFAVNLSSVATTTPAAPATGALSDEELSATIAKVAVTGVAVVAAAGGVMLTAKRYAFSPLKRK